MSERYQFVINHDKSREYSKPITAEDALAHKKALDEYEERKIQRELDEIDEFY
jgi:hypothetical protein